MALEDIARPVLNVADDLPVIMRGAAGHHAGGSGEPSKPAVLKPSLADLLKKFFSRKVSKLGSAELGERILLKRALRQYLAS